MPRHTAGPAPKPCTCTPACRACSPFGRTTQDGVSLGLPCLHVCLCACCVTPCLLSTPLHRAAQTVHVGGIAGLGTSITEEDVAEFFKQTGAPAAPWCTPQVPCAHPTTLLTPPRTRARTQATWPPSASAVASVGWSLLTPGRRRRRCSTCPRARRATHRPGAPPDALALPVTSPLPPHPADWTGQPPAGITSASPSPAALFTATGCGGRCAHARRLRCCHACYSWTSLFVSSSSVTLC